MAQQQNGQPAVPYNRGSLSTKYKEEDQGAACSSPSSQRLQGRTYKLPILNATVTLPVGAALVSLIAALIAVAAYCKLWTTFTSFNYESIIQMALSWDPKSMTSSSVTPILRPQNLVTPPPSQPWPPFACPAVPQPYEKFKCPASPVPVTSSANTSGNLPPPPTCPAYFRYIHEDLRPWKETGITREVLESGKDIASMRVIIVAGRLYVNEWEDCWDTRAEFTVWGFLQLLRRYPGLVPDVEFIFGCKDIPLVQKSMYKNKTAWPLPPPTPPPVFRYCGEAGTLDIPFPDWSFWGWPSTNTKPWDALLKDIKEGAERTRWMDREPYAFWKGTSTITFERMDLASCNVSECEDWNVRVFNQMWYDEVRHGYKNSNLANQCHYRYKVYAEGAAWSVSQKNILACDSLTLRITPIYYDFFSRILMPLQHYWPINASDICESIKFAVDWGNSHTNKAEAIGKAASRFIHEELSMDYVYEYLLHLLTEYASLQRFKPLDPARFVEICPEWFCQVQGFSKDFLMQSMVNASLGSSLCSMPPQFSDHEIEAIKKRKQDAFKKVERWRQNGILNEQLEDE